MSFVLCENCKWSYVDPGNKPGFHYECRLLPPDPNGKRPAVRGRDYCSRGEEQGERGTTFIPGVGILHRGREERHNEVP